MIVNMLVDLSRDDFVTADEAGLLAGAGVTLQHAAGAGPEDIAWIGRTFGGSWSDEAAAGCNWTVRTGDGLAGFCCYEQRQYRWWWLRDWLSQGDVGIFGPIGVDSSMQRKRVGQVLARRALRSLKERGFARAVIGAVGPVDFFERTCGAVVVERLEGPRDANIRRPFADD